MLILWQLFVYISDINEECTRDGECFSFNGKSTCRSGWCSCPYGMIQEGRECIGKFKQYRCH